MRISGWLAATALVFAAASAQAQVVAPPAPPPADVAPSIDLTYKNAHLPVYPMAAVLKHHQGLVILDVTIDSHGRVLGVAVKRSSGYAELDQSARDAAAGWRYAPGIQDAKPAGGIVRVPVDFRF